MNVPGIKGRRDEKSLDDAKEGLGRLGWLKKVNFWIGRRHNILSHSITQIGRARDKARCTQNNRRFSAEIRQMSPLARNKYWTAMLTDGSTWITTISHRKVTPNCDLYSILQLKGNKIAYLARDIRSDSCWDQLIEPWHDRIRINLQGIFQNRWRLLLTIACW